MRPEDGVSLRHGHSCTQTRRLKQDNSGVVRHNTLEVVQKPPVTVGRMDGIGHDRVEQGRLEDGTQCVSSLLAEDQSNLHLDGPMGKNRSLVIQKSQSYRSD